MNPFLMIYLITEKERNNEPQERPEKERKKEFKIIGIDVRLVLKFLNEWTYKLPTFIKTI